MNSRPVRDITQGVYGVLGHDIQYTLSPSIFDRVFSSLRWPAVYAVFDLPPKRIRAFVSAVSDAGIVGFNVTQPYKTRIIEHLTKLDLRARAVGAVNTVSCRGAQRVGYNTDIDGIAAALKPYSHSLNGGTAVVIGTGGAARAVVYTLARQFLMKRIVVSARDRARGARMIREMAAVCARHTCLESIALRQLGTELSLTEADLIVNATPVGGSAQPSRLPIPARLRLSPQTIVFDLNYRPRRTALLARAQRAGCRTIGGWPMLVAQAESAFTIWTGRSFPPKTRQELFRWNPQ